MRNNMLTTKALKVVVAVVTLWDITSAMPLEPEPRQFVYQAGSPSVRLYPVHFELYLKSSSGRFHVTEAQGFLPNMLPMEKEKSERTTESEVTSAAAITTPRPMTTRTTTTSTITSSTTTTATSTEHRMVPMTTMEPMVTLVETTLMPEVTEEEGESLAEARTEQPNFEAVTEVMLEREEASDGTELTPTMMKEEEEEVVMEAVTELNNEGDETMMEEAKETMAEVEGTEEEAVTEMMGEEETVTEVPDLREAAII